MSTLPAFRYHPDPLATGSVIPASGICSCCGQARGFLYCGPIFTELDGEIRLCPWCIASGTAAERFSATFTDGDGVGNYGMWEAVSPRCLDEITTRTPGFHGWQQERWWTHCGEGAAFLGSAGAAEIRGEWAAAESVLMAEAGLSGPDWIAYRDRLSATGTPTAYVFRCLHCPAMGGFSDTD